MENSILKKSNNYIDRFKKKSNFKQMKEKQASLVLSSMGAEESASIIEEITRKK